MPTKKKSQKYLRAAKKAPAAPPARKDSHVISLRLDDEEHAKLVRFQDALSCSSKLDVKLATAVKHAALQHAAEVVVRPVVAAPPTQAILQDFETTSVSTIGAPTITFAFRGDTVRATLAGAHLYGEAGGGDRTRLRLTDASCEVLADITLHPRTHRTTTENVLDVGSALLWSHWRYVTSLQRALVPEGEIATPEAEPEPEVDVVDEAHPEELG